MVCTIATILRLQAILILSASFLCQPYNPLFISFTKNLRLAEAGVVYIGCRERVVEVAGKEGGGYVLKCMYVSRKINLIQYANNFRHYTSEIYTDLQKYDWFCSIMVTACN